MTINELIQKKKDGQKIAMLTAYDYPTAALMDRAGVDMILVGDSLANVVLGLESTVQVGMQEMLHHCKAVTRAVKNAVVVADMPFNAYQVDPQKALANAALFVDEGKAQAVKVEWFQDCPAVAKAISTAGISVMGHVGLTPQTASSKDGFRVQGRDASSATLILEQAKMLERAGCFAIVLECVPSELGERITKALSVPTIGIGAGAACDGQVLVSHDVLGLYGGKSPKFSKKFVDLAPLISEAFLRYCSEVREGSFPDQAHSFHAPAQGPREGA